MTAGPLSDRHGPFPLCVPLLHLPVIVQSRLAAEAPSLTLQKDYKLVRMWTRRRHSEQNIISPELLSMSEFTVTILCFTSYNNPVGIHCDLNLCAILLLNLCHILAETYSESLVTHQYQYNTPTIPQWGLTVCTYSRDSQRGSIISAFPYIHFKLLWYYEDITDAFYCIFPHKYRCNSFYLKAYMHCICKCARTRHRRHLTVCHVHDFFPPQYQSLCPCLAFIICCTQPCQSNVHINHSTTIWQPRTRSHRLTGPETGERGGTQTEPPSPTRLRSGCGCQ